MSKQSLIYRASAARAKITSQRRHICAVLEQYDDYSDIETLHARARKLDPKISLSACYRTMSAFEELGLVKSRDFGDGRARFTVAKDDNHDLLFDVSTGQVVEFHDPELEKLKKRIAKRLGFELKSHCLELHGTPVDAADRSSR